MVKEDTRNKEKNVCSLTHVEMPFSAAFSGESAVVSTAAPVEGFTAASAPISMVVGAWGGVRVRQSEVVERTDHGGIVRGCLTFTRLGRSQ